MGNVTNACEEQELKSMVNSTQHQPQAKYENASQAIVNFSIDGQKRLVTKRRSKVKRVEFFLNSNNAHHLEEIDGPAILLENGDLLQNGCKQEVGNKKVDIVNHQSV